MSTKTNPFQPWSGWRWCAWPACSPAAPRPSPRANRRRSALLFPRTDAAHYEALVAKFAESHPQITVELRPRTWQQLYNPEAESADVCGSRRTWPAGSPAEAKIVDLGPLIEQDEGFRSRGLLPRHGRRPVHEGKTWAIPYGADMVVMYYNRDLFDQYNVPYPEIGWTWDDFLERAVALRDPDAFVFGYGPRLDLNDAVFFIYQHGGQIFDDLENPTRTTFDDPLTIEALDWYARLVHDYDAAPSLNQSSHALWRRFLFHLSGHPHGQGGHVDGGAL